LKKCIPITLSGLDRKFVAEGWDKINKEYWSEARADAFKVIDNDVKLKILGCDIDKRSILRARDNAANLGLEEDIEFFMKDMRDIGVHFSVNRMLQMDAYKNRMERGLTFFEFGYMLMQSYDFLELYRKYNCKLQLGGSD